MDSFVLFCENILFDSKLGCKEFWSDIHNTSSHFLVKGLLHNWRHGLRGRVNAFMTTVQSISCREREIKDSWSKSVQITKVILLHTGFNSGSTDSWVYSPWGSFINAVHQFWKNFDPSPTIVTLFITKAFVLVPQMPWPPPPLLRPWRHLFCFLHQGSV